MPDDLLDNRSSSVPPDSAGSAADEEPGRDPVEELAAEFVERHRSGESPSIEDYALRYPDHAEEIRDLFPTIAKLENLKLQRERSSDGRAATGLPCLKQLGDFRIVREIGRGGMGIVYEAEQLSLRRLVALKVLGAQIANSARQLKRFRREAEAAARLHHTNIVPIFAIGEQDDVRYYAMQFINGPTLAEVIDHRSATRRRPPLDAAASADGVGELGRMEILPEVVVTETVVDRNSGDTPEVARPAVVEYQPRGNGTGPPRLFVGASGTAAHAAVMSRIKEDDWRALARLGSQLADALAYAHDQGILHRDIKPANVLVDSDGLPWLADFGLAKHEDHDGVTNSGDIVGTLRFMAPEQFSGVSDSRSDIYSLGLTLYELITLRPAFEDSRYAPLVQMKSTQAPPTPRSIVPGIPLDLETIILKACAIEPRHRYQSAIELRDDLRRFCDDLPIQARRLTAFEQAWRWARRNPVVASLSTATLGLLVTLAVVFAAGQYRTQRALGKVQVAQRRAEDNLKLAQTEAGRATGNLELALAALDSIIANIANRGVPQSLNLDLEQGQSEAPLQFTTVTNADAALLEELVQFFHKFAEQNAQDFQDETAQAHARIGDIRQRLGQPDEAETAYQQALAILESMEQNITNPPADLSLRISRVWNSIGIARSLRGNTFEAMDAHDTARQQLMDITQQSDDVKYELAESLNLWNSAMVRSGWSEAMMPPAELSAPPPTGSGPGRPPGPRGAWPPGPPPGDRSGQSDTLTRRDGTPPFGQRGWPRGANPGAGRGERRPGPGPGGNRGSGFDMFSSAFSKAVSLLRELSQAHPDETKYKLALARSHRNRARLSWGSEEQVHEAEYSGLEAIEILELLVQENPDNPSFKFELADTYCLVTQQLKGFPLGDRFEWLNSALAIADRLVAVYPLVTEYKALQASARRGLAKLEREEKHYDEAAVHYAAAAELQEQLEVRFPYIRLYLFSHAQTLSEWSAMDFAQGNTDLAIEKLDRAISAIESAIKEGTGARGRGHEFFLMRLKDQKSYYLGEFDGLFPPPPPLPGNSGDADPLRQ